MRLGAAAGVARDPVLAATLRAFSVNMLWGIPGTPAMACRALVAYRHSREPEFKSLQDVIKLLQDVIACEAFTHLDVTGPLDSAGLDVALELAGVAPWNCESDEYHKWRSKIRNAASKQLSFLSRVGQHILHISDPEATSHIFSATHRRGRRIRRGLRRGRRTRSAPPMSSIRTPPGLTLCDEGEDAVDDGSENDWCECGEGDALTPD